MTTVKTTRNAAVGRRTDVLVYTVLVALSAYGGAIGLMTGALDMGHTINQRLPLHSPVLAAVALAVLVGLPSTIVASFAWRRDPRTAAALALAGMVLIGWIVVEIACIREFAFLQVFYAGVGIAFVAVGRRASR